MAGQPRSKVIDESEVGTYHCYNRCVRRAFLCKRRRKIWIREMLVEMSRIFSIDIMKYALQDNHFHLILRNRPDLAQKWSDQKVLRRAMKLFPDKFRRKKLYVEPHEELPEKLLQDEELIAEMRKRLSSISWLMKVLQERIAKRANREDNTTGVFWDGRFRCEALLDEAAVLGCAVYVDLNLTRAGVFQTPEESEFTSAYDRIRGMKARSAGGIREGIGHDGFLSPLFTLGDYENEDLAGEDLRASNDGMFEIPLTEYLKLLDHLGREIREDKRGSIPPELPPILQRIGLDPTRFTEYIRSFGDKSRRAYGSEAHLRDKAQRTDSHWLRGVRSAAKFYASTDATVAGN